MIFNRLAIGTANWGKEYNGAKVSEDDQKRILDYCQCGGIDMIDTATVYEWDWTKVSSYFNVVVKVDKPMGCAVNIKDVYCVMSHSPPHCRYILNEGIKYGASIYDPFDEIVRKVDVVQIPYSLYDRRFEPYFSEPLLSDIEIHVRSVFLRGKIIKAGVEPWKCIAFCLMNPYVDRVIIGADSYEQFKENLRPFHRMDVMKKDDIKLLDPRKWKEEK